MCGTVIATYTYIICNTFTGDLPNKIEVHSMISTYMEFGVVTASEWQSITAIMNANNFSTNYCVTQINGVRHLEAKSSYICLTTFLTKTLYRVFLTGISIENRIERFKYYGKKYAKLPPCMPTSILRSEQNDENPGRQKQEIVADKPWSATLHPNKQIWKEANLNIYGFIHYVHYLMPCTQTPQLCRFYASNSTNTCNFT